LGLLGLSCARGAAAGKPPPRPGPAALPGQAEVAALTGTWVYAGGDAERARVDAAVERAVADMGLAKGFAAEALRPRVQPRPSYAIRIDGDQVAITPQDGPSEAGPLDGSPVTVTNRSGDESQTTFVVEKGALLESGTSGDGSGQTIFTPAGDGETLKVHRVIISPRLSAPVDFTLTYRRKR
jgi:hypothetical protein